MSDEVRVVYGFCQDNCKYPVYTKEDVIGLLKYVIENNALPSDIVDGNYDSTQGLVAVNSIVDQNKGTALKFFVGTQAEYDAYTGDKTNLFAIISDDTTKQSILDTLSQHAKTINRIINGEITFPNRNLLWSGDVLMTTAYKHIADIPNLWNRTIELELGQRGKDVYNERKQVRLSFPAYSSGDATFGKMIDTLYIISGGIKWEELEAIYSETDNSLRVSVSAKKVYFAEESSNTSSDTGYYLYAIYEIIE